MPTRREAPAPPAAMTIGSLMLEISRINLAHGWDSRVPASVPSLFGETLMLVCTELSEAMEEWRNGEGLNEIRFVCSGPESERRKPEGIPIELADAIIRILDLCVANDIAIEDALREKLAYNETRSFRHGGKKA